MYAVEGVRRFPLTLEEVLKAGTPLHATLCIQEKNPDILGQKLLRTRITMHGEFDIELGGLKFHLDLENIHPRILRLLKRELHAHRTAPANESNNIIVIPYKTRGYYRWRKSDLDKFKEFFISVHERFPLNQEGGWRYPSPS